MTKRELITLLESRTDIPDDAELRVTRATDPELSVNEPATRVEYEAMGPLHYVEIV